MYSLKSAAVAVMFGLSVATPSTALENRSYIISSLHPESKIENLEKQKKEEERSKKVLNDLTNYFGSCVNSHAKNVLLLLGQQGGISDITQKVPMVDNVKIQVVRNYYRKGEIVAPGLDELEKKYSSTLECMLKSMDYSCDIQGFNMRLGKVKVKTEFHRDNIETAISYPLVLSGKRIQANMKGLKFKFKYPVRIGHIYDVAMQFLKKFEENPDVIEYSHMNRFNDTNFIIMPINKTLLHIVIKDNKSAVGNKKFEFRFGVELSK